MSYDPNDPNGDVQKMLGCGCLLFLVLIGLAVYALVRVL